jgi:hypothetical protein
VLELEGKEKVLLKNRMVKYIEGDLDKDANGLWYEIDRCITRVGENIVI